MKLVVLDRDGTINHDSDQYIKSPAEWKPIKGSLEAIAWWWPPTSRASHAACST